MKGYNKNNIKLAKELRKNMTRQERKLWYDFLRNYEVKFQRQKAIDNYIVDFYCYSAGLVIELDGSGHYFDLQIEKDTKRTMDLKKRNLRILRISNLEIDNNFMGVCEFIDKVVKNSLPQSPCSDSSAVNFYEITDFGSFDTGIISQIKDLDNAPPRLMEPY